MQLKDIKFEKSKSRKRVGRGGKRGKTSGSGMNGQKSRSGNNIRPAERDFIKKIPKKRGFKFNSIQDKPSILNIATLVEAFKDGGDITPEILLEKRIILKSGGRMPAVKILGNGDLSVKFTVSGCALSASAKEKIEKAGGKIN